MRIKIYFTIIILITVSSSLNGRIVCSEGCDVFETKYYYIGTNPLAIPVSLNIKEDIRRYLPITSG